MRDPTIVDIEAKADREEEEGELVGVMLMRSMYRVVTKMMISISILTMIVMGGMDMRLPRNHGRICSGMGLVRGWRRVLEGGD